MGSANTVAQKLSTWKLGISVVIHQHAAIIVCQRHVTGAVK